MDFETLNHYINFCKFGSLLSQLLLSADRLFKIAILGKATFVKFEIVISYTISRSLLKSCEIISRVLLYSKNFTTLY